MSSHRCRRRAVLLGLIAVACRPTSAQTPEPEPSPSPSPEPEPVTPAKVRIALVRHAEKQLEPPSDDPPLTPEGEARARNLVTAIPATDVRAILSTDTLRTRSTAAPVAEAAGVEIAVMEPGDVEKVRATAAGLTEGTLLVVGHANTLPQIVEALTGEKVTLTDADYGDLFVVTLADPPTLSRAKF